MRYSIDIVQEDIYHLQVEANSQNEAREKAIELWNENQDEYFKDGNTSVFVYNEL